MALPSPPSQIQIKRWGPDKFWGRASGRRPPSKKSDAFWGTLLLKPFFLISCSSRAESRLSFCRRNNHIMHHRDTLYESGLFKGTEPIDWACVCLCHLCVYACVQKGIHYSGYSMCPHRLDNDGLMKVTERPSIRYLYSLWDWMSYLRSHNLVPARLWEVFSLHRNLAVATVSLPRGSEDKQTQSQGFLLPRLMMWGATRRYNRFRVSFHLKQCD